MKKMSRLLALVMALVLALGSVTTAMAEDSTGYALGDLTAGLLQGWSDAIWGHYANEFYNELKATTTEEEYNTVMASHSTAVAEKLISSMTEEQRADLFAHNVDLSAVNGEALTATAEDGGVVVDVPAGAFPTGTVANVAAVTDEASAKKIADAFANVDGFIPVAAYDFSFVYDFLGIAKEVQPAKAVPLIFEVDTSEFGEATSLQIYHMVENADGTLAAEAVGEAVEINTAKEKQTVSVSATSFSVYVLTVNGKTENVVTTTVMLAPNETITVQAQQDNGNAYNSDCYWRYANDNNKGVVTATPTGSGSGDTITITAVSTGNQTLEFGRDRYGYFWSSEEVNVIVTNTPYYNVTFIAGTNATGSDYVLQTDRYGKFTFPDPSTLGFVRDGWSFAGWSEDISGEGDTFSAGIEGSVSNSTTVYNALWYNTSSANPATAYFFIRLDGDIPYEPKAQSHGSYKPNYNDHSLAGSIYTEVSINNNLAAVAANIASEPTEEAIKTALGNNRVSVNGESVLFDPEKHDIVWYVIKHDCGQNKDHFHVDGIVIAEEQLILTYDPNGGTSNVPYATAHYEGDTVEIEFAPIPTKTGYVFIGWDYDREFTSTPDFSYAKYQNGETQSLVMPDKNEVLYAIWQPSNATPYTVKHYLCDVNGENPELREEETLFGTTDAEVTAEYKSYEGYTPFEHANSKVTGVINPEGTLELRLYYKLSVGQLSISKEVESATGAVTDTSDTAFEFTVTFKDVNGNVYASDRAFPYEGSKSGNIGNGGTIELKNGESITIKNLPHGTQYLVVETVSDDDYYSIDDADLDGSITAGETAAAAFTNTYTKLPVGDLTIIKTVKDSEFTTGEKQFSFTLALNNGTDVANKQFIEWAKAKQYYNETKNSVEMSITVSAESKTNSLKLEGLPIGSYTVTEDTEDIQAVYQTTYAPEGGAATVTSDVPATVTVTNTAIGTYEKLEAIKLWNDNANALGYRPASVPLTLVGKVGTTDYAHGKTDLSLTAESAYVDPETKEKDSNKWVGSWEKVPMYDADGNKITYTVTETAVPDKYEASYDGMSVTNSITVGVLKVTKIGMKESDSAIFKVTINGTEYLLDMQNESRTFVAASGSSYSVDEDESWSTRYTQTHVSGDKNGNITAGTVTEVTFKNDKTEQWLTDEKFVENTIKKQN